MGERLTEGDNRAASSLAPAEPFLPSRPARGLAVVAGSCLLLAEVVAGCLSLLSCLLPVGVATDCLLLVTRGGLSLVAGGDWSLVAGEGLSLVAGGGLSLVAGGGLSLVAGGGWSVPRVVAVFR